jgi:hypothetical protein
MALPKENYLHKLAKIAGLVGTSKVNESKKWIPPKGVSPDRGRLAGLMPQRETQIGLRQSDEVGSK